MPRVLFLIVALVVCGSASADEPNYERVEYQFVQFFAEDRAYDGTPEEGRRIQKEHVEYFRELSREGRVLAFGPIGQGQGLLAVAILDAGSLEAADKLVAGAPWIRLGRLRAETHPWWAAKGILHPPSASSGHEIAHLGLLMRPRNAPEFSVERLAQMQRGHLANIQAMADAGDLVIAGPMGDDTSLRGILVFRSADRERLLEKISHDPSVQANRLAVELYEWYLPKGTLPPLSAR